MKKKKAKSGKRIYMDYASATPLDPRVDFSMKKVEKFCRANPSALHKEGRDAKKILEDARKSVAGFLGARSEETIFTSGATESNNLAIIGLYESLKNIYKEKSIAPHIIASSIEHKSVLEPIKELERRGASVTFIDPEEDGSIDVKKIRKAMTPSTMLVSIMYANNEIGVINPIEEIASEVRHARRNLDMIAPGTPYLHTDAVQAVSYIDIDARKLNADFITLHGAKVYGPACIGALFVKTGSPLCPIIFGGGQENGMRSGRELSLFAHGLGEALRIIKKDGKKESKIIEKLRDYFFAKVNKLSEKLNIKISVNGSVEARLPNNINICVPGLDAEFAVYELDERGIACSSQSTCMNSSEDSYSYVVEKLRGDSSCSTSSLRFSIGRWTVKSDVDYCIKALEEVLLKQRNTPWNKLQNNK